MSKRGDRRIGNPYDVRWMRVLIVRVEKKSETNQITIKIG